ncbi:MAG: thiamine monophosphate synthase [Candidatus Scalindua rubra]|uniref:3-hexulose-6-phosphate synthase n=1 Tax=Candidatus Scalindua rubra TaxID=1872076 RepID=A0A1E3XAY1_9BACT|nr:MAG: thiamine monophosphate synthase [Candidatus Scalindua rubra]
MNINLDTPILQVALDFINLRRAINAAKEATEAGVDWIEVGTPLIKSEGLNSVRALRREFPNTTIVADMKTMDAGRLEMETAAKAGADIAVVMGDASDSTIKECINAGGNYGIKVEVDFIGTTDCTDRAISVEKWGADFIGIHTAIDEQMLGNYPFKRLSRICSKVSIPVAVAGGINSETVADAINAGAKIIVVGGAICKATDIKVATANLKKAMSNREKIAANFFKRASNGNIREILEKVSTANISNGSHRLKGITGLQCISLETKMIGQAVTVRTYPGDWAKPVEAIDKAEKGNVIVIDSGGVGPAVWGELATHSAIQRGLAGVAVNGAIRDSSEIRKLQFPTFAKLVMPNAGEPKGFGEIGVPINISGITINNGDWIVGDDDGLIVIPKREAKEMVNHAMDWLEKENRIREEISQGKTSLGEVIELLKWTKK